MYETYMVFDFKTINFNVKFGKMKNNFICQVMSLLIYIQ